ncbi:transposon Ty3-I Gag-Pol polyprotein [Trichonephila clavipes]|nr:transposon Ty3-I Gag-Pol polyprotein [Trichonephila clavipes]
MAFLGRSRKDDLRMLATELGLAPSNNLKIIELKDLLTNSDRYDEEFVKDALSVIVEEHKKKTPANIKEHFLDIWADLNDPLELAEKLDTYESLRTGMKSNPNQTFKKKEEFRKPFPIKKNQPVGGSHDNHSPGPSRTVPRFPSYKTEGRNPIQCYGCGTPGVVKSKCPTCTRANEMEIVANCITLLNFNSDLYPSSEIVLKIFGEKIAICADTSTLPMPLQVRSYLNSYKCMMSPLRTKGFHL